MVVISIHQIDQIIQKKDEEAHIEMPLNFSFLIDLHRILEGIFGNFNYAFCKCPLPYLYLPYHYTIK